MTAAVSVVGLLFSAAVAPVFAKRFFTVEEDETVSDFRFVFHTAEHATDLEQRADGRAGSFAPTNCMSL